MVSNAISAKTHHYYFFVHKHSSHKSNEIKKMAIDMYLEGLGFRSIGRVPNISYGVHINGLNSLGDNIKSSLITAKKSTLQSLMKSTVMPNTKNHCWTWIAIDRQTKQVLGFVCGKRDTNTFVRLYNTLNPNNIKLFCSDYGKSYDEIIPRHKHLKSKAQTFTIESYNSLIRHFTARFKRKTKCYSKCKKMIKNTLNLLFAKWSGGLGGVF